MRTLSIPGFLLIVACGDGKGAGDTGASDVTADEADADADTDADADSDADTDVGGSGTPVTTTDTETGLPEPTCADAPQPLDEQGFVDGYVDKYCWWWTACGNAGPCPATPQECIGLDATVGCQCLDATWSCDGARVVPAESCERACAERGTDTTTTTSTTSPVGSGGWWTVGSGSWTFPGGSGGSG